MTVLLLFLSLFTLSYADVSLSQQESAYEKAKTYLSEKWKEQQEEKARLPASEPEAETSDSNIEDIILGGPVEKIETLKSHLDENDSRHNILEVHVAPGLLYHEAKSDFYYRDIRTYSPSLYLGAAIWFSPFVGFSASYLTSLGATVKDDINNVDTSIVSHEWFRFDLSKRKFVVTSDSYFTFSLSYKSYAFKSPADSPTRGNIESNFYGFGFEYGDNNSGSLSKIMGVKLFFFGDESEKGATTDFSSGTLDKSYSIEVYRKWKYRLNRKNIFFLNLDYQLDQHVYSNSASPIDPVLNTTINGVEVRSEFLKFSIGYEWGS